MIPKKVKDITGERFGLWTVVEFAGAGRWKNGIASWLCKCDCGTTARVAGTSLRKKNGSRSCGCVSAERAKTERKTHGFHGTPTYKTWRAMKARCTNPKNPDYHRYGGRGIKYCDRWESFEGFVGDMGERPAGRTLDRVKNHLGYSFDNCRWATPKEQANNRRSRTVE